MRYIDLNINEKNLEFAGVLVKFLIVLSDFPVLLEEANHAS